MKLAPSWFYRVAQGMSAGQEVGVDVELRVGFYPRSNTREELNAFLLLSLGDLGLGDLGEGRRRWGPWSPPLERCCSGCTASQGCSPYTLTSTNGASLSPWPFFPPPRRRPQTSRWRLVSALVTTSSGYPPP